MGRGYSAGGRRRLAGPRPAKPKQVPGRSPGTCFACASRTRRPAASLRRLCQRPVRPPRKSRANRISPGGTCGPSSGLRPRSARREKARPHNLRGRAALEEGRGHCGRLPANVCARISPCAQHRLAPSNQLRRWLEIWKSSTRASSFPSSTCWRRFCRAWGKAVDLGGEDLAVVEEELAPKPCVDPGDPGQIPEGIAGVFCQARVVIGQHQAHGNGMGKLAHIADHLIMLRRGKAGDMGKAQLPGQLLYAGDGLRRVAGGGG